VIIFCAFCGYITLVLIRVNLSAVCLADSWLKKKPFFTKQSQYSSFLAQKQGFARKTKPNRTQTNPKQSQFKAKQSQYFWGIMLLIFLFISVFSACLAVALAKAGDLCGWISLVHFNVCKDR
ncbi:MAG: hypothetical protein JW804_01575, partial [Sedimentisphaerales bacterium]|nr:hypothetical protein [Sedimentisphaerales bacterium]